MAKKTVKIVSPVDELILYLFQFRALPLSLQIFHEVQKKKKAKFVSLLFFCIETAQNSKHTKSLMQKLTLRYHGS